MNLTTKEDLESIKFKITLAIEFKQIYKDPDLCATKFAAALDISDEFLSFFLTEEHGKSFRTFINDIRINKVLEEINKYGLMLKVKDYAILGGYRSRVTFYNAFKSRLGISLIKFLQKNHSFNIEILKQKKFPFKRKIDLLQKITIVQIH